METDEDRRVQVGMLEHLVQAHGFGPDDPGLVGHDLDVLHRTVHDDECWAYGSDDHDVADLTMKGQG